MPGIGAVLVAFAALAAAYFLLHRPTETPTGGLPSQILGTIGPTPITPLAVAPPPPAPDDPVHTTAGSDPVAGQLICGGPNGCVGTP